MSMSTNGTMREMPKYQCHKIVWALKIRDIRSPDFGDTLIVPEEEDYAPFSVSSDYMDKHKPQIGGYYVFYEGGYKSYSPAKEFEEGYTLIK